LSLSREFRQRGFGLDESASTLTDDLSDSSTRRRFAKRRRSGTATNDDEWWVMTMDNLSSGLGQLCRHNRDGGRTTQKDRERVLALIARQLKEMGFRHMSVKSLNGKDVMALRDRWLKEGLNIGTIKNRLAHLRWWAGKVNRAGIIPADNGALGIGQRQYVAKESKGQRLTQAQLDRVRDPYVAMSLRLQQAFGLRREEAIKFQPAYADRGDHIALKGSWTKGGRARTVPITTPEQRAALDAAHRLAGAGALIPAGKRYIDQRHVYDGQCKAAGLRNMHGLRHGYAQTRYETLTGWKAPAVGGPLVKDMTFSQHARDYGARQTISRELGHERVEITSVYLGRNHRLSDAK
jgi:hypothetical protein